MKSSKIGIRITAWLVLVLSISIGLAPWPNAATAVEGPDPTSGVVSALEGRGEISGGEGDQDIRPLEQGSLIGPWDSVTTAKDSKAFLTWTKGLAASLGEFSTVLFSPEVEDANTVYRLQLVEGLVRVTHHAQQAHPDLMYEVVTPVGAVSPARIDEPADFVVEVYEPAKTTITVISGKVRVKNPRPGGWGQRIVSACQSVTIEEGKDAVEQLSSSSEALKQLVVATTIPRTLSDLVEECRIASVPPYQDAPSPPPPRFYEFTPDQYVHYWDVVDVYPYDEIRIVQYYDQGCTVLLPGIGQFYVTLPPAVGWTYDSAVLEPWVRYAFIQKVVLYERRYLHDIRSRHQDLHRLIHLAQISRRPDLLRDLRRQLEDLTLREEWTLRRLQRLEHRVSSLDTQRRQLAPKLPRELDLDKLVTASFGSEKNINTVNAFQNRIANEVRVQNRLADVTSAQLIEMKEKIAREKDPAKRLAFHKELGRLRGEVFEGNIPLPHQSNDVKQVLKQLAAAKQPEQQDKLRKQLLQEMKSPDGPKPFSSVPSLDPLRKDIAQYPNPRTKEVMQRKLTEVQKSMEARTQAAAKRAELDRMAQKAAAESEPKKREELLRQLHELSKSAPAGSPTPLQFIQEHPKRSQGPEEKTRAIIQQKLDDLRTRESSVPAAKIPERPDTRQFIQKPRETDPEPGMRQRLERQKLRSDLEQQEQRAQELRRQQVEREKQAELQRRHQEEQNRQAAQRLREQQEQARQKELQQKEQEKRAQELRRQQVEREKQAELQRRHQEEQNRQAAQRLREQQEQARQKELQQKEQEKRAQELRRQQVEREKQAELQRRHQEEQNRQAAQRLREQQERMRQAEAMRKQQEQARRQADQLRHQQMQQQIRHSVGRPDQKEREKGQFPFDVRR